MLNLIRLQRGMLSMAATALLFTASCKKDDADNRGELPGELVLLVIDEESIDNGNPPNNFSETDVNDPLADEAMRDELRFFKENTGKTIELFTGEVGDEGWHAIKTIPASWQSAGPGANGAQNYLAGAIEQSLLDKVPDATPLRATALKMLIGKTILAVVYDSDISTNYSPLNANLQGATLGLVVFDIVNVVERTDGSSSSLPRVTITIRSVSDATAAPLMLFSNAPVPQSSSEPYDIAPPANVSPAILVTAP